MNRLSNKALGGLGEDAAAHQLIQSGLEILARNWRCPEGELDIIARDGGALVICEVKTRSGTGFGFPLEAVTNGKARRLRKLALRWLAQSRADLGGRGYTHFRFDVIGVLRAPNGQLSVQHVQGVA